MSSVLENVLTANQGFQRDQTASIMTEDKGADRGGHGGTVDSPTSLLPSPHEEESRVRSLLRCRSVLQEAVHDGKESKQGVGRRPPTLTRGLTGSGRSPSRKHHPGQWARRTLLSANGELRSRARDKLTVIRDLSFSLLWILTRRRKNSDLHHLVLNTSKCCK